MEKLGNAANVVFVGGSAGDDVQRRPDRHFRADLLHHHRSRISHDVPIQKHRHHRLGQHLAT
jgi:hypothetical protein